MKLESKTFQFKIDDTDSQGIIRGFASTFGNIDLGDDVMEHGAFKKTLKENKGKFPILDSHDPTKQIGWNIRAEEDEKGLFVEGQIDLNTQLGKEKYSLAKKAVEIGAKMGLSIGYSVIKAEPDKERQRVRRLKEVKLFEYSIVTFPMNQMAMITDAKWDQHNESLDDMIRRYVDKGYTIKEIEEALYKHTAAEESKNPLLEQSLDELINLFSRKGN